MSRGIGLLSNRVKAIPPTEADVKSPDRYTFLDVASSEPNLSVPPADGYFLTSDTQGNRAWLSPDRLSLNGNENELVFIKEGVSASTTNIEYDETTESIKFNDGFQIKGNVQTVVYDDSTSSASSGVIATFDKTKFGSAKFVIQAQDEDNNERQITELLVAHNNTTATSTEFGVLTTTEDPIAEFDVDILDNNVRLKATNLTEFTTTYRVSQTLMLAIDIISDSTTP